MSFSAFDRPLHLAALANAQWDLLIIGGGITGAGILLDAVSRGLKAVLIEKGDFASGTSSKSTKLIHGGLRYLKNFEISLVREVGRERAIVHANARHLVRPEPMLLPIYHDGSIGRITGSIGLWFYDLLADVGKTERRRMLSLEETLAYESLLTPVGLLGSGLYYEYRTDDARLTLAIIRKAVELGGLAVNYCEATGFSHSNGSVSGVQCTDMLTGNAIQGAAHVVVNATGPWMDDVINLHKDDTHRDKKLLLSKGVHIVLPKSKLPVNQSMYFDTPVDGRMIFCIPRDQSVYIGTTDTIYDGPLHALEVKEEEMQYLLDAINHVIRDAALKLQDISGSWAGLRPLIYEEGKAPSELSRRDEIFHTPDGLISIAGGKLTGYRRMAERVVDLALKSSPLTHQGNVPCATEEMKLCGGNFASEQEMESMLRQLRDAYREFPESVIPKLFYRYGDETGSILSHARSIGTSPQEALIRAEVSFSIRHEMTHNLADFLLRRTADIFFDPGYYKETFDSVLTAFSREWNWDQAYIFNQKNAFQHVLHR